MDSTNQNQSPPPAGTGARTTSNGDQSHAQNFVVEAQGSLSPYPLNGQERLSSYPSPVSNQGDGAQQTQYGNQYGSPSSPQVSEPTWVSSQQPLYMESSAPAHPDLSNRPAGMTPREAAEKRENDILSGMGGQSLANTGTYSPAPVQADLSNRPPGMTPREAAEKREQAILRGNTSANPPPVPAGHVVSLIALRQKPMPVDCPGCQRMVTTRVDKHVSEKGTMWSVVICLCLGVFCFWIPLVMDDFKEYEHRCPNCHVVLAAVDSDGRVTHVYNQLPPPHPSNHTQPQYSQQQQQQSYPQPQQQPQPEQKQEYGTVQERPIELRNENSFNQQQQPMSPQEVPADASTEVRREGGEQPEIFELPASTGSKKSKKGFFGKKK